MVEILDEGPHDSVAKEIICQQCGARLKYTPIEVKRRETRDYTGGSGETFWIECPKCKSEVITKVW